MADFAIFGDIVYARAPGEPVLCKGSWAVCENGVCSGVFPELPDRYAGIDRDVFSGKLIIPGYTDLHLHAPQYRNIGLGMDLQLMQWLEQLTYPEEARFSDTAYADTVYSELADSLKAGSTVRACIFSSRHTPSTVLLMDRLEASGLCSYVGKVNMDCLCADIIREKDHQASLHATCEWLEYIEGRYERTRPIITPRFVPCCSRPLMEGLGKLAGERSLPIQSHLSENREEIALVASLFPECPDYTGVYEKYGLLSSKTVMAHCIHSTEAEAQLMKDRGVYIAHCPSSNTNVRSGLCPTKKYMDAGMHIGLGSDISGGNTLDMAQVIRDALGVSKQLSYLSGCSYLSSSEAFWLATKGGGSFFGKAGSFEEGYSFDAVVIDDSAYCLSGELPLDKRFEKLIYQSSNADITAKYVCGRRIF